MVDPRHFPAGRHKKRGWAQSEKPAQEQKKISPPLLIPRSPSPSPITHTVTYSPWPLRCCTVPARFQWAANGLLLIYMQLRWDTCSPSSPPNDAAQEKRDVLQKGNDRLAPLWYLHPWGPRFFIHILMQPLSSHSSSLAINMTQGLELER